ncbi:MAG: DUF4445 domain-containing protein [Desulfovibrionaceae bacterium]|nr:DUF4445 domain-containing protein [Desulfovibrionaceae bacterium]
MQILLQDQNGQKLGVYDVGQALKDSLARFIFSQDASPTRALCAGQGHCRRCQMRFVNVVLPVTQKEEELLSQEDLRRGIRLGCEHLGEELVGFKQDIVIELASDTKKARVSCKLLQGSVQLAFDLGTTNICWQVVGTELYGTYLNPQGCVGSDVMLRVSTALESKYWAEWLAEVVRKSLKRLVQDVGCDVEEICLVGNTIMTELFLQHNVQGLARSPYHLDFLGQSYVQLPHLPPIYIPPLLSPYVGSDLAAGLAYVKTKHFEPPWLLVDLGTNAEFGLYGVLDKLYVTSVPLGPALEGMDMQCGAKAGPNTLNSFALTPQGVSACDLDTAQGISATGYLSLVAHLVRLGVVQEDGMWAKSAKLPIARKILGRLVAQGKRQILPLSCNLWLDSLDLEALLKVRAAFATALELLLKRAKMPSQSLKHILLAGALGQHVAGLDLETLGFLPLGSHSRLTALGNAALAGSCLLLQESGLREELAKWLQVAQVLDLSTHPDFERTYVAKMHF